MLKVEFVAPEDADGVIRLSEVEADEGEAGVGKPVKILCKNSGDESISEIVIKAEGAVPVEMATDDNGEPGFWAPTPISHLESLAPGSSFSFWARGNFSEDDAAGIFDFDFVVKLIAK